MADEQRRFKARPESTIAQNFAADLDSMFGLDPVVEKLTQTVEEKKQTVSSSEQQLQELEARLRETEKRLARVSSRQNSPARPAAAAAGGSDTASAAAAAAAMPPRKPSDGHQHTGAARPHPFAQRPSYPDDRPPTAVGDAAAAHASADPQAMVAAMPGAMPEAARQYSAGNDYVMVEGGQGQRGYG